MTEIPNTPQNRRLVNAITRRLESANYYISSVVWIRRMILLGISTIITGTALALIFWSYARFYHGYTRDEQLSQTLANELSNIKLTAIADGTVKLLDATVHLADNQYIQIASNSSVGIIPDSRITAATEVTVAIPFENLQPNLAISSASSDKKISTTSQYFSVFKMVPYKNGQIVTAWRFKTANQNTPEKQSCYFTMSSTSADVTEDFWFAENGKIIDNLTSSPNIDVNDGFTKCIWF